MKRALLTLLLLCALVVTARQAHASSNYPQLIHDRYMLKRTPDCTLCHSSNAGGPNTVTTFFGRSLLAHGAQGTNNGSLETALSELEDEQTDSDGDGIPDIDELRGGSDPNDGPGNNLPIPQTGCALSRSEQERYLPALPLALALMLLLRRARSPKIQERTPIIGERSSAPVSLARHNRDSKMARELHEPRDTR